MVRGLVASIALGVIVGCAALRATPQQVRVLDAFAACKADLGIQLGNLTYVSPDGRRVEVLTDSADKNAALVDCLERSVGSTVTLIHPRGN